MRSESHPYKFDFLAGLPEISRLYELTTRLTGTRDIASALQEVLEAAIDLQGADFGAVQVRDKATGGLSIVGQKGFSEEYLQYFAQPDEWSTCGRALKTGERVIIEDIETDPGYAPHRAAAAKAGYRGSQCTLLRDSSGEIVGALSTHFRKPHRPSERELWLTDLYAAHAGNVIAARLAQEELKRNEERYAFLLALSDRKRQLSDQPAIKAAASKMLGEFLGADCAGYVEMLSPSELAMIEGEWRADGGASPNDAFPVHALEEELRRELAEGRPVQVDSSNGARTFLGKEFGAAILAPVIGRGDLVGVLYVLQDAPRRWRPDETTLCREVAARTWAAIEHAWADAQLQTSELRLRTLVEGIPQLVWRADEGGDWSWASSQWTEYTGLTAEDSRKQGWLEAVHPDDREEALAAWSKAAGKFAFDVEYRLRRAGDGAYRAFRARATPVVDERGNVLEWLGTSTDIDDMRRLRDRQRLLVAELQHRTRNLLAVVRSVGEQTFDTSESFDAFWRNFAARIDALSRAQKLISRSEEAPVTLTELINAELSALVGDEKTGVRLSGASVVPLPMETVQMLTLALHELATNALRHGALGRGQVDISWRVDTSDGETHLQIDWSETGAQIERAEARRGFGRELIEDALPYQHEAVTEWELLPEGVRCRIRLPISERARNGAL